MAENLFTDYPERIEILKTHSHVRALVMTLEETLGEPGTFKNADEGMEIYLGMMEELGKFAAQDLKPHAAAIDREHATPPAGTTLRGAGISSGAPCRTCASRWASCS